MKKTLIAAALGGVFATGAWAQSSNVTVYGVMDMGIRFDNGAVTTTATGASNGNASSATRIQSGMHTASRLGFRGEEDLGNGLKAGFLLETGIKADTGTEDTVGQFWERQSKVTLSSTSWGLLQAGRVYTASHDLAGASMSHGYSMAGSASNFFGDSNSRVVRIGGGRISNSVRYTSPSFSGLTFDVQHGRGEAGAADAVKNDGNHTAFGLNYKNGGLLLGFTSETLREGANTPAGVASTTTVASKDRTAQMLGGNYDFGTFKLFANWGTDKRDAYATVAKFDAKFWNLGANAKVGNSGTAYVTYGQLKQDGVPGQSKKATLLAISYDHALSKRTKLYVSWGQMKNEDGSQLRLADGNGSGFFSAANVNNAAAGSNNTVSTLLGGVVHSF